MAVTIKAPSVVDPVGPPPTFVVRTDRTFFTVELASDPILFQRALATRRNPEAYYSTTVSGSPLSVHDGRGEYRLADVIWPYLRRHPFVYYRATAYDAGPVRMEATVADADYARAPSFRVARPPAMLPHAPHGLSASLPRLHVDRNRLVNPAGDVVVLRGVLHRGLEAPGGRVRREDVRALVHDWHANLLRLGIDQRRALTDAEYLRGLDRVIAWAAAEGAYTLLALTRLDEDREFGHDASGAVCRSPALPEENTVRLWTMLAARYRSEPAVLYEPFDEPHEPFHDDRWYPLRRAANDAGWHARWHDWVRRLAAAIRHEAADAVLVVSGWRFGLDLRAFPINVGGLPLANTVYSTHVFTPHREGRSTFLSANFDYWFGFARLRSAHPIVAGAWGGAATDLEWGDRLERYMRVLHRFRNGEWPGLAGWAASSWAELANAAGGATEFGELVRGSLRTMPSAASADFDRTRPASTRSRDRIEVLPTARRNDFFLVRGHDFSAGARIVVMPSVGVPVRLAPTTTLPHLLVLARLPASLPTGAATVQVARADGTLSESTAITITADPLPNVTVLVDGAAKASPYTLLFLANPVVRRQNGTFVADPIQSNRRAFHETVATALRVLFGTRERLLVPYAHEIRVVARYASAAVTAGNALCRQEHGGQMWPEQAKITAFLSALPLAADHVFVVFRSSSHGRATTYWSVEAGASAGQAWTLDGAAQNHRQTSTQPGTTALTSPTAPITALHEFLHGADVDDLYVDSPPNRFVVNRKRKVTVAAHRPAQFATLDGIAYATDLHRDGLGYPAAWLSYHPALVDTLRPNVMDDYHRADDPTRCRLDVLTLRYMRDRLEWKLQR